MGTKVRGGITLYNVKNGKDAEYHRLRPQSEKAVVGADNSLYITLSYIIEHVNGAQVTTEAGSAQGYHVTARMNNGVTIAMINGAVNSGTYKLTNYSKEHNRPDYVIIELRDSADKVVDIRTAQIIMEASSYVDIVADLRTTVSQHGDSISTIKQTANSVSATITSLKNGLVEVGFELDGEKKSFTVTAENFKVQTPSGKVALMTSDGKVNADLIEAKSIRTSPSSDGLHINMYEGTFDVLTKDNKKGISMTVDKDGFPHLIFFDNEGNAKYDLGYTGLKELVSAYQAAYWTKRSLVNVTDKGLSAVYPKTVKGIVWHDYHAARHYATGKLGDNADEDGKLFSTESFGSPIPDGWYTEENEKGQYLEGGNESVVDEDNHNTPKSSVFSVAIFKAENGRLGKAQHVWFSVTNGRVSFCDPDGKPLVVTESLLQNYPFDQYKDRV